MTQETPRHTRTKQKHQSTTLKEKMGYLHIHWKRNKEDYKAL
jgi:hypothetical protein